MSSFSERKPSSEDAAEPCAPTNTWPSRRLETSSWQANTLVGTAKCVHHHHSACFLLYMLGASAERHLADVPFFSSCGTSNLDELAGDRILAQRAAPGSEATCSESSATQLLLPALSVRRAGVAAEGMRAAACATRFRRSLFGRQLARPRRTSSSRATARNEVLAWRYCIAFRASFCF